MLFYLAIQLAITVAGVGLGVGGETPIRALEDSERGPQAHGRWSQCVLERGAEGSEGGGGEILQLIASLRDVLRAGLGEGLAKPRNDVPPVVNGGAVHLRLRGGGGDGAALGEGGDDLLLSIRKIVFLCRKCRKCRMLRCGHKKRLF